MIGTRMWQGKVLIVALFCVGFFVLYSVFENRISQLDDARIRLTKTLASLQLQDIHDRRQKLQADTLEQSPLETSLDSFGLPENILDDAVIVYNRVPKTASTSFMGVAYDLCGVNKFHVLHVNTTKNMHVMSLSDQVRFVYNISMWSAMKPAIYHGHVAYLDFGRFGIAKKPIYINIIRKPLDRLVSYFYFLRHGDDFRPNVVRRRQGNKMTFDECVAKKGTDCESEKMWLQIPFFCGHAADCWIPGNEWALLQAKHNLVNNYFAVGLTEQLQDFISVLEVSLPRFFKGATRKFANGKKSHLRRTSNKQEPSEETVQRIQESRIWQMENEFYEFAAQQFNFLKKRTILDNDGGELMDRGQQFFYEKIRPK